MILGVDLGARRHYSARVDMNVSSRIGGAWTARVLRSALLMVVTLGLGGCARRIDLTPAEFERLQSDDPGLENLRVYPHRKLISRYSPLADEVSRDVTKRKVIERGARKILKRIVGRRVPGKVLKVDELNGMPRLWVTFWADCMEPECAYAFVQTERQRYALVSVPARETYKDPANFRRNRLKRNRLKPMRVQSMVEVNEVLAAPRRSGKGKPIDLQIRKDRRRPTQTRRERAGGIR